MQHDNPKEKNPANYSYIDTQSQNKAVLFWQYQHRTGS